jgi:hypothetical protein
MTTNETTAHQEHFPWVVDISDDGRITLIASRQQCFAKRYILFIDESEWTKYGQKGSMMGMNLTVRISGDGTRIVVVEAMAFPTIS